MVGWMDAWMDGWMDGWMGEWRNWKKANVEQYVSLIAISMENVGHGSESGINKNSVFIILLQCC